MNDFLEHIDKVRRTYTRGAGAVSKWSEIEKEIQFYQEELKSGLSPDCDPGGLSTYISYLAFKDVTSGDDLKKFDCKSVFLAIEYSFMGYRIRQKTHSESPYTPLWWVSAIAFLAYARLSKRSDIESFFTKDLKSQHWNGKKPYSATEEDILLVHVARALLNLEDANELCTALAQYADPSDANLTETLIRFHANLQDYNKQRCAQSTLFTLFPVIILFCVDLLSLTDNQVLNEMLIKVKSATYTYDDLISELEVVLVS